MVVHEGKARVGHWAPHILEAHVAPKIGSFTRAQIADLSEEFPDAKH